MYLCNDSCFVSPFVYLCMCLYACVYVCEPVCVHVSMFACMCLCVCVCESACVCVCLPCVGLCAQGPDGERMNRALSPQCLFSDYCHYVISVNDDCAFY